VIVLVRHGETDANRAGVLLGRADPSLNDLGRTQVAAVARALADGRRPIAVVTSPLRRARETAAEIASQWDLDVEVEQRLVEIDYGEWDERGFGDVPPAELARWRADPEFAPPGGESLASATARAGACAEELLERAGDDLVVAVSHVSPIKGAVAWTLGADPGVAWRLRLDVASITRIMRGPDGPVLLSYNEKPR